MLLILVKENILQFFLESPEAFWSGVAGGIHKYTFVFINPVL